MPNTKTRTTATTVATYTDEHRARHRIIVRRTDAGWEVIDVAVTLIDQLDPALDDQDSAEALGRAYAEQQQEQT